MASFEILLISVRSDTPTSFFLVLSKTALVANWDFCCPGRAAPPAAAASFLRPARLVTAYKCLRQRLLCLQRRRGRWTAWAGRTMADARPRAPGCWLSRPCASCLARLAVVCAAALGLQQTGGRGTGSQVAGRRSQAQCVCVWRERKSRAAAKVPVWRVRLAGSVPSASAILPTMSPPTSAVSAVGANTGARTATPWLRALHK